jgi:hypothetical protein
VAAIFWAWLWGPVGLILATPLTVCLVVMGKYVPQLSFLNILLGDEPVLRPHVRYYQRLLAGDADEAKKLLGEHLAKEPLERVYDQVVVGALALAQRDFHRGLLDEAQRKAIHAIVRSQIAPEGAGEKTEDGSQKTEADGAVDFLCLPARDEGDELVGLMLGQLLRSAHFTARTLAASTLVSEMVEQTRDARPRMVCVSALPPSGIAHSRYLCKRLHRPLGELPMLVGLWRTRGDTERARERIGCGAKVRVATSLAQAMEQIRQQVPQAGGVGGAGEATAKGPAAGDEQVVAGNGA